MGHLHSSISVLWGGCLLQSYDLLLMLLITSWHFGSTKTWGAILNSVQKVKALIEPATPKRKGARIPFSHPAPRRSPDSLQPSSHHHLWKTLSALKDSHLLCQIPPPLLAPPVLSLPLSQRQMLRMT